MEGGAVSLDVYLVSYSDLGGEEPVRNEHYEDNITHNLAGMAKEAHLYAALWRPDENGYVTAADIAPLLRTGLERLQSDPFRYRAFDSPNGWGTYKHFVPFVERYLAACEMYPNALVEVSR